MDSLAEEVGNLKNHTFFCLSLCVFYYLISLTLFTLYFADAGTNFFFHASWDFEANAAFECKI